MLHKILFTVALMASAHVVAPSVGFAQGETSMSGATSGSLDERKKEMEAEVDNMSSEDRLSASVQRVKDMKKRLASTQELLDATRDQEKDIRKLNCIAKKTMTMKGYVSISEQSYIKLKDAESKSPVDIETARHHFILIAVAYNRVLELYSEARLCVGQSEDVSDEGRLEIMRDPDIVQLDPEIPGGYLGIEEVFGDVLDPQRLPELTPLQ